MTDDEVREEPEPQVHQPDLDRYVYRGPSPAAEFLLEQARRVPWWTISFLVHLIVLLILYSWPYGASAMDRVVTTVPVNLVEEIPTEILDEEPEPIEDNPVEDQDLEVPIEDIPISPVPPTNEAPGPDLEIDPVEDMVQDVERPVESIDPPSATPIFAIDAPSKGLTRGIYSGRNHAGRSKAVGGRGGTTTEAESAVMAGLVWLATAQERDGSWNAKRWDGAQDYSVGMTGMALLAFLGAGYTHTKGKFKTTVARGLNWLKANQKADGNFGWRTYYEHGIAAMAVGEAYGLTQTPFVGRVAQKAIDSIVKEQPAHGGFVYGGAAPKEQGDTSVTGWQIMAIKSGICAELKVPDQAVERSRTFLKNSWREYGQSAYRVGSKEAGTLAITSVGMLCRIFLGGEGYEDEIRQCADFLLARELKDGKAVPGGASGQLAKNLYYTYYSALSMFQFGGEFWSNWNTMFRDPLVKLQVQQKLDDRGRFVRGSWDPANHTLGKHGGRVYTTAMAILSLEVYYRFLPVYKK